MNEKQAPNVRRTFNDVINELRYGACAVDLDKKLNSLVAAVASTGMAGEMTLTIKIKPSGGSAVEVIDKTKLKLPELPAGATVMFTTKDFGLSRQDERQLELGGLRVAGGTDAPAAAPLKEAVGAAS